LIVGLKEVGASVAVTADGINDAPALKHANVGFCMGISGVEVAKEASDIIILDDNFTSVFKAAQWGRSIYDNIRKFIQFQLTVNMVALLIVFLGGSTLGESPLSVIQLLWVNMVMDTLAALSLATEPPHPTELKKERVKKHDKIIIQVMWRSILGQVVYQFIVLVVLLYFGPLMFNINYDYINEPFYREIINEHSEKVIEPTNKIYHYTLIFHTFMLMNLFN
jgi:Ca2+-transporting ATPase